MPLFGYSQGYCQRDDPVERFGSLLDETLRVVVEYVHHHHHFQLEVTPLEFLHLMLSLDPYHDLDHHHDHDLDLEGLESLMAQL